MNRTAFTPELRQRSQNFEAFVQALPERLDKAMQDQVGSVQYKYQPLLMTIKPLRDLVNKYKTHLANFVETLQKENHIHQLSSETNYYKGQIDFLNQMDAKTQLELSNRKAVQKELAKEAYALREKLSDLKLEKVKLQIKLNELQQQTSSSTKTRERFFKSVPKNAEGGLPRANSTCQLFQQDDVQDLVAEEMENLRLQRQLLQKVASKVQLHELLGSCMKLYRKQLKKTQKMAHSQSLVGTLLFKIQTKENRAEKLNTHNSFEHQNIQLAQHRRMDSDLKFLIYNSLRRKYDKVHREAKLKQEQTKYHVDITKFLQFNPLQVVGLMELKEGSFNTLTELCNYRKRQVMDILE